MPKLISWAILRWATTKLLKVGFWNIVKNLYVYEIQKLFQIYFETSTPEPCMIYLEEELCSAFHNRNISVSTNTKHCVKSVPILSFPDSYFPAFRLNTGICSVNLCIQSEWGKMRTWKTPKTDTFYKVRNLNFSPEVLLVNDDNSWRQLLCHITWERFTDQKPRFHESRKLKKDVP